MNQAKGRLEGICVNSVLPWQVHAPLVEASFVTGTEIVVDGGMSARCD